MTLFRAIFTVLALLLAPICAHAQGQIGSGHVLGNPTAAQRTATDTTLTALFDRAMGATQGSIFARSSTGWAAFPPGNNTGVIFAGPTWASQTNVYNGLFVSNGYPLNAMFGNNAIALTNAIAGGIEIPASAVTATMGAGLAGYARTASTQTAAVGVYGQGLANANGTSAFGMNCLASNAPQQVSATNTGFTSVNIYCHEADVNILKSGGGAPSGNAYAYYVNSASEIQPTGEYVPFYVALPAGGTHWKNGFKTADNSSDIGITLGSVSASANSNSQAIIARGRNGSNTVGSGSLALDNGFNWIISPGSGGAVNLTDASFATILSAQPTQIAALKPFLATNVVAPGTPSAGLTAVYVDSTTKRLSSKNDAGTVAIDVVPDAGAANNFLTAISAAGVISKAQPTVSNLATGTSPAFTLGGTVSGGGNQINNVIIGTSTPLAGFFAGLTATSAAINGAFTITNATQFTGFNISNGTNFIATLIGLSGTNDGGDFSLLTGGVTKIRFSASAGIGNYINNGNGFNVGATADPGAGTIAANSAYKITTNIAWSATAPTISAGFCTSPSIVANNGIAAFTINVGTACAAGTGTIGMPTATNGWVCAFHDVTSPAGNYMEQTGGTASTVTVQNYSRTLGTALNFTSSDVFRASCVGY